MAVAHLGFAERAIQLRQALERFCDAELVAGDPRRVAEQALDLFREASVAELSMHLLPLRFEEEPSLFELEPGALTSELDELNMSRLPRLSSHCLRESTLTIATIARSSRTPSAFVRPRRRHDEWV